MNYVISHIIEELEKLVKNEGCVLLRHHVMTVRMAIKLLKELEEDEERRTTTG